MTAALSPVVDWYVNQLAEHGPAVFLGVQAVIVVALWCTAGIALVAHEQRRTRRAAERQARDGIRVAENYANHPAIRAAWEQAARKEDS